MIESKVPDVLDKGRRHKSCQKYELRQSEINTELFLLLRVQLLDLLDGFYAVFLRHLKIGHNRVDRLVVKMRRCQKAFDCVNDLLAVPAKSSAIGQF